VTNEQKTHYAILAVLGIGAFIVLAYLMRSRLGAGAAAGVSPGEAATAGAGDYPTAPPIQLGDFTIQNPPVNLTYNTDPNLRPSTIVIGGSGQVTAGSACGCDGACVGSSAGVPYTSLKTISPDFLQSASSNLGSFGLKLSTPMPAPSPTLDYAEIAF
jgi:hypothetical protein